MFKLYKQRGAKWSAIAKDIEGRTENEVKNRFYSTLRRIATKKAQEKSSKVQYRKATLLQFVDDAIEYGHTCSSKRGRKKKRIAEDQPASGCDDTVFKPFAVPSPPPTAHTAAKLPPAVPEPQKPVSRPAQSVLRLDPSFQQALQRLIAFQGNCISLLRQQIIESMASGSAFRPYSSTNQRSQNRTLV